MKNKEIKEIFSERLRTTSKKLGVTQAHFCRTLKLTRNTVSLWFKGEVFPRDHYINDICDILGVEPSYMFGGNPESPTLEHALDIIEQKTGIKISIPAKFYR